MIYERLSSRSRRAFRRLYKPRFSKYRAKEGGRFYQYRPRGNLLERLSAELGMEKEEIKDQLRKERIKLLREIYPAHDFKDWEV